MHPFEMNEEGQGLVEYALILLLIAMAVIIALGLMGSAVLEFFEGFAETLGGFTSN